MFLSVEFGPCLHPSSLGLYLKILFQAILKMATLLLCIRRGRLSCRRTSSLYTVLRENDGKLFISMTKVNICCTLIMFFIDKICNSVHVLILTGKCPLKQKRHWCPWRGQIGCWGINWRRAKKAMRIWKESDTYKNCRGQGKRRWIRKWKERRGQKPRR